MRDPERERLDELAARIVAGTASEAEREEVALILADRPDLETRATSAANQAGLGGEWLDRVEADRALAARENHWWIRTERIGGAGLFIGGLVLSMVAPAPGGLAMVAGLTLAGWSFVRTRIRNAWQDPYRKIRK